MATALDVTQSCSPATSLTVRNAHAMAYDSQHEVVLLFGGADDRQVLGDMWSWDGSMWRCVSEVGPAPRTFPGLAYDRVKYQLVLFGGNRVLFGSGENTNTFLDDMWIWDGKKWSEFPGKTPPSRAEPGMVFDSHRNRVVLFGGHTVVDGERVRLGDTWEWDGEKWECRSTTGPSARNGVAMTFDSRRGRVVLFGGSGGPTGDTWEWDGQNWVNITSAESGGRFNSTMTFDQENGNAIRFGGWTGKSRARDTWRYDSHHWQQVADNGPKGRNHASMTYDDHRKVVVMYGGHDGEYVFGDTWELDNAYKWSLKAEAMFRHRIENGH
jgi:hypothetical protein